MARRKLIILIILIIVYLSVVFYHEHVKLQNMTYEEMERWSRMIW